MKKITILMVGVIVVILLLVATNILPLGLGSRITFASQTSSNMNEEVTTNDCVAQSFKASGVNRLEKIWVYLKRDISAQGSIVFKLHENSNPWSPVMWTRTVSVNTFSSSDYERYVIWFGSDYVVTKDSYYCLTIESGSNWRGGTLFVRTYGHAYTNKYGYGDCYTSSDGGTTWTENYAGRNGYKDIKFSAYGYHYTSDPDPDPQQPVCYGVEGPPSGEIGMSYSFTTSGYDPDGTIQYYYFDWGDGTSTNWVETQTQSHAYSSAGTYYIYAAVSDNDGLVSEYCSPFAIVIGDGGNGGEEEDEYIVLIRVFDRQYRELSGATVSLTKGSLEITSTTTNSEGKATLTVTDGGDYVAKIEKEGYESITKQVKVTDTTCPNAVCPPEYIYLTSTSPIPGFEAVILLIALGITFIIIKEKKP